MSAARTEWAIRATAGGCELINARSGARLPDAEARQIVASDPDCDWTIFGSRIENARAPFTMDFPE